MDQGAEGDFDFFHGESHPDAIPRTHSERHPDVRIDFGFVFRAPAIRIEFFRIGIIILVVVEGKCRDRNDDAFLDVNPVVRHVLVALPLDSKFNSSVFMPYTRLNQKLISYLVIGGHIRRTS